MKFTNREVDLICIALSYLTSNLEGVSQAKELVRDAYMLQGWIKHKREQEKEEEEDICDE